jgi:hypothetical protein
MSYGKSTFHILDACSILCMEKKVLSLYWALVVDRMQDFTKHENNKGARHYKRL